MAKTKETKKPENTQENLTPTDGNQAPGVNPVDYAYPIGHVGNTILKAIQFLQVVSMEETKVYYEPKDTFEATMRTAKEQMSEKGIQAVQLFGDLANWHTSNIASGEAIHRTELQKQLSPKFEMEPQAEEQG